MTNHIVDGSTKQRLIEAAGEVFAEHGFRRATVREIVGRAGANVAAINYHFRDKMGLYLETLAHAQKQLDARYPIATVGMGMDDPEEQFRAFVRMFMRRHLEHSDRPGWYTRLFLREVLEPTVALDDLVTKHVSPNYRRLREICRAVLGTLATDEDVRNAALGVLGECLSYKHMRPVIQRLEPDHRYDNESIDRTAEHIAELSLAGLRMVRERVENGGFVPGRQIVGKIVDRTTSSSAVAPATASASTGINTGSVLK